MPIRRRGGAGGGGGGLVFREPRDLFANAAARSLYFTTTEPTAYLEFVSNRILAVILGTLLNPTYWTYVGGTTAYDDTEWVNRTGSIVGPVGPLAPYYEEIFLNAAVAPGAAPVGGAVASAGAIPAPPPGGWVIHTDLAAPGAGENTYASLTRVDPVNDTFPLVPTWSYPYEVGNPAGAIAARVAAEAAATRAETAETDAETARDAARNARDAASTSAGEADTSSSQAGNFATNSLNARDASRGARDDSRTARDAAQTAQGGAETAQTASAGSASDSAGSASAAAASAAEAAASAAEAAADRDGTVRFGVGAPDNALGNNGDSYWTTDLPHRVYKKLAGVWTLQFTIVGGTTPVQTHNLYVGWSADAVVTAAEVLLGASSDTDSAVLPAETGQMYTWAWRSDTDGGDPTEVHWGGGGNQRNIYGAASALEVDGVAGQLIVSANTQNASVLSGVEVRLV